MEKKVIDGKEVWVDAEGNIVENYQEDKDPDKDKETKTYTQEELDAKLQSETDKRVSQAIKTAQEKWQTEYEAKLEKEKSEAQRLAQMSEEDKRQEELSKREKELADRENRIKNLELESQAKSEMSSNGLPVEFTNYVMGETAEQVKANITTFKSQWETAIEKAVNERLQGTTPKTATKQSNGGITKEQFKKMSISEKTKLFNEDPDLYNQLKS